MKALLTTVENVYHQPRGQQPQGVECRHQVQLQTEDDPYVRNILLFDEWLDLEMGWLKGTTLVVIQSQGDKCIVEVGVKASANPPNVAVFPFAVVMPGQSCRFQPAKGAVLAVRGCGKALVTFFPE